MGRSGLQEGRMVREGVRGDRWVREAWWRRRTVGRWDAGECDRAKLADTWLQADKQESRDFKNPKLFHFHGLVMCCVGFNRLSNLTRLHHITSI